MSAALDLLNDLARSGVVLSLSAEGRLKFRADPGAYNDDRKALVAANREALIAALQAHALGGGPRGPCVDKSRPASPRVEKTTGWTRPTPYWRRRWATDPDLRVLYGLAAPEEVKDDETA